MSHGSLSGSIQPWSEKLSCTGIVVLLSASATWLVIIQPVVVLFLPLLAVAWGLSKPTFRLLFFIFGAFAVFQTGDGLSGPKLFYFSGVAFSVVIGVVSIIRSPVSPWLIRVRPALIGSGLLAFWILVPALLHALIVRGVSFQMWARDAITYLLICAAVVLAIDAGRQLKRSSAYLLTMVTGSVAAVGFTAAWVQKRGFGDEGGAQNLMASIVALTIPLTLGLVLALSKRRINLLWLLLAVAFFVAVIVTGTRGGFVLVLAVVGIWGSSAKYRIPVIRLLTGMTVASVVVAISLPIVGALVSSEAFVAERVRLLFHAIRMGMEQDYSGVIRQRAETYALTIFIEHPLMGQGLGVYFQNPNPNSAPTNFTIDTPATYLAKFGLLGTVVLIIALVSIITPMVWKGGGSWGPGMTTVRGAAVTWLALLPFGPTTEDKGFAIGIALGLILLASDYGSKDDPVGHDSRLPLLKPHGYTRQSFIGHQKSRSRLKSEYPLGQVEVGA